MTYPPDDQQTELLRNRFQRIKEAVLSKRPVLREIMQKRGKKNLYDYAREYIDVNLNPPIQRRQDELISTIQEETELRLGPTVAESVARQLERHYYVSTVDHHGPICHPFFLNGNLASAAPYASYGDPDLQNVVVLACANISLNNSSFPRGLLFNTYVQQKIQQHKLSFFPAKDRLCPVYNFRPYTAQDIAGIRTQLDKKVTEGVVRASEATQINAIIDEIYLAPDVLAAANYSDQITKTNFELWKKFFASSGVVPPNLVYLEQEMIVARLLVKYHLFDDTTITHMLFDPVYDALIEQYFNGIMGAFDYQTKAGTYMFWALPKGKKYRMQMWKEGRTLVSEDGSYRLELTPEAVKRALEEKEVIPNMMLVYAVLAFYYGVKCLGGFNQVNYLTQMKNAYIKMNVDRGNYRSIEVCARSQTKEMGGDYTIAFLGGPNGELVPATGLDLILYGDDRTWPILIEESKQIGLEEALDALMPEFYPISVAEAERDPELLAVTPEEITRLTGMDQKIRACVTISEQHAVPVEVRVTPIQQGMPQA